MREEGFPKRIIGKHHMRTHIYMIEKRISSDFKWQESRYYCLLIILC
jgi:hypothetical protein